MTYEWKPGRRYRMPVVFGPAIGPRQHPEGRMWTPEETGIMSAEWIAVKCLSARTPLEALLPPGFELRGEPSLSISCAWFRDLYWLAGRGYGIVSLSIPATYRGKTEIVDGAFCPVIWEGAPDAIITGREELGFPKLFADIPEIEWDRDTGSASCWASGFGHRFFDIKCSSLTETVCEKAFPGFGGGPPLYYKYVPRSSIGGLKGADVEYVTTAAPPPGGEARSENVDFNDFEFRKWSGRGSVAWHTATFQQLPTTFHIVNAIAGLPILEVLESTLTTFSGPGIGMSMDKLRAVEPAGERGASE
jgi:hypothetical protein